MLDRGKEMEEVSHIEQAMFGNVWYHLVRPVRSEYISTSNQRALRTGRRNKLFSRPLESHRATRSVALAA